ncbi:hypothetical protein FGE12_11880 [Aggregicoccus sp. 17bor-14]|uniref:hypothetical protein n=1 Tax=Myxococcaceae TaxID=31 RepID=UPI00129CA1EA|nr:MULTISPECIES: hypothetical protein [Myxococcaceae]MBF5043088.1 hypothetical protein [Simulacricoccus sp. 17bor-14]MRI88851.1 hypothetical protein [Aggregicoccus sp. 17bor-14]
MLRLALAGTLALLLHASAAAAQTKPVASPPPQPAPAPRRAPPAHSGFQMAVRTGIAAPLGKATAAGGDSLSDSFDAQVPLTLDVGGKIGGHFFLGGYAGLGLGGAGRRFDLACSGVDVECVGYSFRLGVLAQYNLAPAAKVNPWLGYGAGVEGSGVAVSTARGDATSTAVGWDFARLMGGVDFRLPTGFGVGPYAELALGRYDTLTEHSPGDVSRKTHIADKAVHGWLNVGVRIVLFP